ncbi:hypothetical protein PLICRDRAFT_696268 [Plicaturopsis crispa FD-325 SS-3]|nr:hypothetical protein PLICRDRAFT_696268 [Plicaturopsis crispa FD-325 SS-3]
MSSRPHKDIKSTRLHYDKMRGNNNTTHPTRSPPSPIPRTSSPLSYSPTNASSSSSRSNSAASPPSTPRGRYPSSLGRVPLHRRGTSKTYERLEDLLREAGYKETRVFTPESERAVAAEQRGRDTSASVRGGVDAVVGFLAGFVPAAISRNASSVRPDDLSGSPQSVRYSPPASPLAHKRHSASSLAAITHESSTEGTALTRTQSRASIPDKDKLPHSRRPQPGVPQHRQSYTEASKARAYLRHMASAPNIAPADQLQRSSSRRSHQGHVVRRRALAQSHQNSETEPPLPPTWLETVARAVLTGGTGAHVGGPADVPLASNAALRSARSNVSAFTDQTNRAPVSKLLAPPLCAQIPRGQTTAGSISHMRVVCRSAPGSRSGSQVRDSRRQNDAHTFMKGKGKRNSDELPSLARTEAENDGWTRDRKPKRSSHEDAALSSSDDDCYDEEDDDGELDLARLLVPPKRQNSIRSLRKHLQAGARHRGSSVHVRGRSEVRDADGFGPESADSGEEGYGYGFEQLLGAGSRDGSRRSTGTMRRRGLPGSWAQARWKS